MTGVLTGLSVLDLSRGIAGPMTTMLMADNGAHVTRIIPPEGDPFAEQPGQRVWNRGKAVRTLDLKKTEDLAEFLALVDRADVLVESFTPGVTDRLGIGYEALAARNPALIYLSITAYGPDTRHSHRPGFDALVAARTGLQWEQRGWPECFEYRMSGKPGFLPDLDVPYEHVQGPARPGPVFSRSTWPSLGAFFAASVGVNAALRARGLTGRGQHVETSLLQGAIAAAWCVWQRPENPDVPNFPGWVFGSRAPKGHFKTADGKWIHQWVPNPRFIIGASETNDTSHLKLHDDPDRLAMDPEELLVLLHYQEEFVDRVARFDADHWLKAAADALVPLQECRSVEAGLNDQSLLDDGAVVELDDPELGPLRQVGSAYRLSACPSPISRTPRDAPVAPFFDKPAKAVALPGGPLSGVRVLDFGLAIAGPYGTQILSDLGADVIKINSGSDTYWHQTSICYSANRGKRSLALNLKDPRSKEVLRKLVESCDVVQHNMRYEAAVRLAVDYDALKQIKPDLIYCHTRGFERGWRDGLPGNDQTGACLAGIEYEDGAIANGGKPLWSLTSFGDTGNGFLSAIAMIQAVMHRERTGEGQFIDTSIVNACLLNTSYAHTRPGDLGADRPQLNQDYTGLTALYRLYETREGWLCIAAAFDQHWQALCSLSPFKALGSDPRFATADARRGNDLALSEMLGAIFLTAPAAQWFELLDAAGVPVEQSDPDFGLRIHDDPEMTRRNWVVSFADTAVGRLDQPGICVDFSETPGKAQRPPLVVGDHSRAILREIGLDGASIEALIADKVVLATDQPVGAEAQG